LARMFFVRLLQPVAVCQSGRHTGPCCQDSRESASQEYGSKHTPSMRHAAMFHWVSFPGTPVGALILFETMFVGELRVARFVPLISTALRPDRYRKRRPASAELPRNAACGNDAAAVLCTPNGMAPRAVAAEVPQCMGPRRMALRTLLSIRFGGAFFSFSVGMA
jgi:hypothetical protein